MVQVPESSQSDYSILRINMQSGNKFPYRQSGPFIQLSIKVKTQDFWEDGREATYRGREKLVTFGKLSVNFRKLSGET